MGGTTAGKAFCADWESAARSAQLDAQVRVGHAQEAAAWHATAVLKELPGVRRKMDEVVFGID
jgi:hypothetical protein